MPWRHWIFTKATTLQTRDSSDCRNESEALEKNEGAVYAGKIIRVWKVAINLVTASQEAT